MNDDDAVCFNLIILLTSLLTHMFTHFQQKYGAKITLYDSIPDFFASITAHILHQFW